MMIMNDENGDTGNDKNECKYISSDAVWTEKPLLFSVQILKGMALLRSCVNQSVLKRINLSNCANLCMYIYFF